MKYSTMICHCCGKKFYNEYWEDGYIDHYVNFASRFDSYVKRDVERIVREITMLGNTYRRIMGVTTRLDCFKKYCEANNLNVLMDKVENDVMEHLKHLKKLDNLRTQINIIVEDLTDCDKEYLGLKY